MRLPGKRRGSAIAACLFAALAGLSVLAPTASAGTVQTQLECETPLGNRTGNQTVDVTLNPTEGPPGTTVLASVDLGPPPLGTAIAVPDMGVQSTLTVAMAGAAYGTIELISPEVFISVPQGAPITPPPFTSSFVIPDTAVPGIVTLRPVSVVYKLRVAGSVYTFQCAYAPGTGPVATVNVPGVGLPTMYVSPQSGPPGFTVFVRGSGLPPGADFQTRFRNAAGWILGLPVINPVPSHGIVEKQLTVNDPTVNLLRVSVGGRDWDFPITVLQPGGPEQSAEGEIRDGGLHFRQAGAGIQLSPVTLTGRPQTMNGALNQIAVQDFRGATLGWDLTGALTDFVSTERGGTLPSQRLTWTPSCAVTNPLSPSVVSTGSAGSVGLLCKQNTNVFGQVSGGEFSADAALRLAVPSWQLAGTYRATLTLTLI